MSLFPRHNLLFFQLLLFVSFFSQLFCSHRCMRLNTLLNLIPGKCTYWIPVVMPMTKYIWPLPDVFLSSGLADEQCFYEGEIKITSSTSITQPCWNSKLIFSNTISLTYSLMISCSYTKSLLRFQLYSPFYSFLHFSNISLSNVQVPFFCFAISQSSIKAGYISWRGTSTVTWSACVSSHILRNPLLIRHQLIATQDEVKPRELLCHSYCNDLNL